MLKCGQVIATYSQSATIKTSSNWHGHKPELPQIGLSLNWNGCTTAHRWYGRALHIRHLVAGSHAVNLPKSWHTICQTHRFRHLDIATLHFILDYLISSLSITSTFIITFTADDLQVFSRFCFGYNLFVSDVSIHRIDMPSVLARTQQQLTLTFKWCFIFCYILKKVNATRKMYVFFIPFNLVGTVYDDTSLHIQALYNTLLEYENWILS